MARPKVDLKKLGLIRYESLKLKRAEIESELSGLQQYLKAVGGIGSSKPTRRVKGTPALEVPSKSTIPGPKRKISATNAKPKKPQKKVSATESILSAVEKSDKGISIDQIMKETGLKRQTVFGVLATKKKEGKVKAKSRGVYVKANQRAEKTGAKSQSQRKRSRPSERALLYLRRNP